MNPLNIMICGHRRSGNNYLMALIAQNFYREKWIQFPSTHLKLAWLKDRWNYIYIHRNRDDVLKSIFNMRRTFFIDASNYEEFLTTKYSDMILNTSAEEVRLYRYDGVQTINATAKPFSCIEATPIEFYDEYINYHLLHKDRSNFLFVSYDALAKKFQSEMKKVAVYLGFRVKKFRPVNQRVGYYL